MYSTDNVKTNKYRGKKNRYVILGEVMLRIEPPPQTDKVSFKKMKISS